MVWMVHERGSGKKGRVVRGVPRPLCYACEGGKSGNLCERCLREARERFEYFRKEGERAKKGGRAC